MRLALSLLSLTLGFSTGHAQTAKWKTFSNRAGWSIDYPAEWKISSCHSCSDVTAPDVFVSFFPPAVKDYDQGSLMIEHLTDKPADKSAGEWLADVKKTNNLNPQIKEEKFKLNSLPALRVRYRNPVGSGYETETVYVVSSSKTFAITFEGKAGTSVETLGHYTIYLRMLSSFTTNR